MIKRSGRRLLRGTPIRARHDRLAGRAARQGESRILQKEDADHDFVLALAEMSHSNLSFATRMMMIIAFIIIIIIIIIII